jgi:hypothetical protein
MSLSQAVRSPQFIILLATNFFCCATHCGPIIRTVSYAISCGIAMAGSLGMATGPIADGLIYDTFASYAWLYIGAWRLGHGHRCVQNGGCAGAGVILAADLVVLADSGQ